MGCNLWFPVDGKSIQWYPSANDIGIQLEVKHTGHIYRCYRQLFNWIFFDRFEARGVGKRWENDGKAGGSWMVLGSQRLPIIGWVEGKNIQ